MQQKNHKQINKLMFVMAPIFNLIKIHIYSPLFVEKKDLRFIINQWNIK